MFTARHQSTMLSLCPRQQNVCGMFWRFFKLSGRCFGIAFVGKGHFVGKVQTRFHSEAGESTYKCSKNSQKVLIASQSTRILSFDTCGPVNFSGGSDGKVSVYNVGDLGPIPGSGRFPGEGNGNPLQYSCLENPMDSGACCRLHCPWGCKESDTTE